MDYLKLLKDRQLDILKEFHKICEENNLKYTIAFGTMIGCVRHEGFIPWDDDIDVLMPKNDYYKFMEIGQKLLGDAYFLQNDKTDKGYRFPYAKIRLNNSCLVNPISPYYKYSHKGIYIDIFPVHYLPKSKSIQKFQKYFLTLNGHIITTFCWKHVELGRTPVQKFMKFVLLVLSKIMPYKALLFFNNKVVNIGTDKNSDYLCCYASEEMGFMEKYTFKKNYFKERILMKFEDGMFYMPKEYDAIMTHIYGDYMAIPKEKKTHEIKFATDNFDYDKYLELKEDGKVN